MVTRNRYDYSDDLSYQWLSTDDDKEPTEGVAPNSLAMELDTGKFYYFDGTEWKEFGAGA